MLLSELVCACGLNSLAKWANIYDEVATIIEMDEAPMRPKNSRDVEAIWG